MRLGKPFFGERYATKTSSPTEFFFSLEKLGKLIMLNFSESVAEYIFSIANSAYRAELKRRKKLICFSGSKERPNSSDMLFILEN